MYMKKIVFFSLLFVAVMCLSARLASAARNTGFTVQVETVSFEPAARAVVNRLKARGYDAYFESHAATDDKVLYKVRFGRFANREEAVAAAKAYKKQEQRNCFVVQIVLEVESPGRPAIAQSVKSSPPSHAQAYEKGKGFYTLQVAAKTDKPVAQKFADRLQQKGYCVYVREPAPGDSKPFYRIRIGRYAKRAQAEQAGRAYAEREQGEYLVVLSPPEHSQTTMAAEPAVPVVTEKKSISVAGSFFTVQVGVCKTSKAAESHADTVRVKGFDPYIVSYETSKGKILYRVRIGRFKERSRAAELARAYEQKGGRDFIIVRTEQGSVLQKEKVARVEQPVFESLQLDKNEQRSLPGSLSIQETVIVEDEPVVVVKSQPGRLPDSTASTEEGNSHVASGSAVEVSSQSPASVTQVTKIYAYSGSGNELNLTNAYAKIPKDLLGRIQYVSIFPVMLLSVPEKGNALVMEVEGMQRRVALAGLRLPGENRSVVSAGIQQVLSAEPLRLKYSPDDEHKDILIGTLFYRSGVDLQIEILKRGLALVDAEKLPLDRQAILRAAQQRARELNAGIWVRHLP